MGTSFSGRIVTGIDGSPSARRAADWAALSAVRHGVGLTVIRVTPEVPIPARTSVYRALAQGVEFADRIHAIAEREVDDAVSTLRLAHPDLDVQATVVLGHPVDVLTRDSAQAHSIVVGATGAGAFSGALLGGTSFGVVHHAHCPVVVIPRSPGDPDGPIVVGLAASPTAESVAEAAITEAAAWGRELVAVHVRDLAAGMGVDLVAEDAHGDTAADTLLTHLTEQAEARGVSVRRVVAHGSAAAQLADQSGQAALTIVGSRGTGGFSGLLLGSVSRATVAAARGPIMVVRG